MSIRVRGNSFQVDVGLGGVRVRHTVSTKAEAQRVEAQVQAWLLEGHTADGIKEALAKGATTVTKPAVTFRQLVELADSSWGNQAKGGNSSRAHSFLKWAEWYDLDVTSLDTHTILQKVGEWQVYRGITNSTANRYLMALSKMFTLGIDNRLLSFAPKIPQHEEKASRVRWLTKAEEEKILAYWKLTGETQIYHHTVVMLDMGLRNGEVEIISADDIREGCLYFYRPKVNKQARLPMSARAQESLKAVGRFDICSRTLNDKWARMTKALRLNGVTPYTLRHTKASRLAEEGFNSFLIQEWMGHANITTTARYVHVNLEMLKAAATI